MYTVTITKQGQISIPAKLRRELGLEKTKKATVSREGSKLIFEPVKDILELAGSLKTTKKPLSNKELEKVLAKAISEEYAQKLERIK